MSGPTTSDPAIAGPLDRGTAEALLARADVLLAASEFEAARAHYARLIGFPDPAITGAALLGTGEALFRLDDEAGALWSWEQVTRLPENPSAYAAWRQVAAARVRAGSLRTAFEAYKQAERRAPAHDRAEIASRLATAGAVIERLVTIPGIGRRTAEIIVAEIGLDMARFGSARQLASWAGMCPGNYESAGTSHGGRTRRGSPWLRSTLVSCARSASRTHTYLGAQYRRLAARRGARRAFVAVGHTILGIVYHVIRSGRPFEDLGPTYFDRRDADRVTKRLTRRLEDLGYDVVLRQAHG